MQPNTKRACALRLKRIEGQIRGIAQMVDADRYCIDVITQIQAARAGLKRVEDEVLKDHVGHCVEHAIASGSPPQRRRKVEELMKVLERRAAG